MFFLSLIPNFQNPFPSTAPPPSMKFIFTTATLVPLCRLFHALLPRFSFTRFAANHNSIFAMGAGGSSALLLWCLLVCGLVECNDTERTRRDVHRIIIREQVARGRGPHHHYRGPSPSRSHVDGRHRVPHDSYEFSDEYEVNTVYVKNVKRF